MKHYDVVVIGAGPGGYTVAADLATKGIKVALIEKNALGGNCVNYGCIPTKALLSSAKKINSLKHFDAYGIDVTYQGFNYNKIQNYRKDLKAKLNNAIKTNLETVGVTLYFDNATVLNDHEVQLDNKEILSFDKLVLATGSRNRFLNLPGFEKAIKDGVMGDSDYFLTNMQLPKTLTIIGGGPISVEFAYFFATLGVKVTILQDMATIIPQFDTSSIKLTTDILENLEVKIIVGVKVEKLTDDFKLVYQKDGESFEIKSEKYMLSVGRVINDESFTNLKLVRDERNRLVINNQMQTSLSNVYALGDLTAQIQLSNVAYIHSGIITCSILGLKTKPLNLNHVPYALYLNPELAAIGVSEQWLNKNRPGEFAMVELPAAKLPRNQAEQTFTSGFFKILVDKKTHLILGAHLGLTDASIIINELALAMSNNLTIEDLANTAHTHPTLSEAIYYATRALSLKLI